MKNLLKILDVILFSGTLIYLVTSFITMESDVTKWTQNQRGEASIIFVILNAAYIAFTINKIDRQKAINKLRNGHD